MFRKVKQANRSNSPYLPELIWASFEHLKWAVQQLTQDAHSVPAVPASSSGSSGKGQKGNWMWWRSCVGIANPAGHGCSRAGRGREGWSLKGGYTSFCVSETFSTSKWGDCQAFSPPPVLTLVTLWGWASCTATWRYRLRGFLNGAWETSGEGLIG